MGSTGEGCMKIEISDKKYERFLYWDDANMYCNLLVIDDKCDWRLPTKEELNEIFKSSNALERDYYWSSTEYHGTNAWGAGMKNGGLFKGIEINCGYARAVRSII